MEGQSKIHLKSAVVPLQLRQKYEEWEIDSTAPQTLASFDFLPLAFIEKVISVRIVGSIVASTKSGEMGCEAQLSQ